MVQVVTNENIVELIQTGKVAEFKAPDAKPEEKPLEVKPSDVASKEDVGARLEDKPRGEDGKFVAKDKTEGAAKAEVDDPADENFGADLPERVTRQMARKHKAMKEAEEFGRQEYRDRRAAEERAERAERALAELQSQKSGPAAVEGADKEPNPEDFKTVGEYTKALTKYEVAQANKAQRASDEQRRQQESTQVAQTEFGKRVAEVMKEIPDYSEVVSAADVDVPAHIAQYIVESPVGPQLGYALAKDLKELDRLKSLSPIRAIAELGKLEITLEKKPDPPAAEPAKAAAPQVSRAPAPITPLETTGTTAVIKDPKDMSFQELRAHRMAERRARGR
jgi:hypothetical protein